MRKTKEILRLKWQHGRSHRQIAAALAIGDGVPSEVNARARAAGLTTWAEVDALSDNELEARLYPFLVIAMRVLPTDQRRRVGRSV